MDAPLSLFEGRYKWSHDVVLRVICDTLSYFLTHFGPQSAMLPFIPFVP
jgi:hypothetical protein